ncbi:Os01g0676800 [Oryza sativa Japonica Group]|uniref:Os01g0676800 protein n=1 Tax=Oryza sativa subsp. japonica TaxID=39947 RepID=A0A0P0V6G6_ORYSJ|nr:hypothetical protein EE612_004960 [Oryza sativa]BAS73663.1 Os01g0676800 [Oryza sativa Japonica Group]
MHEFAAAGRSVVAEIDSLRANNTCLRIFTDNTHHQLYDYIDSYGLHQHGNMPPPTRPRRWTSHVV